MATEELVRPQTEAQDPSTADASAVKTILVHIQNEESAAERIEAALAIARAASAHVTCLHVTPVEAYVAFDSFGGVFVMNDIIKSIDEEAARVRHYVEDQLRSEDVSWEFDHVTGHVATEILSRAALADLVVTGREPRSNEFGIPAITLLGDLLQTSRTPLFIPGRAAIDPVGAAVIAWNGSYEAANAVRMSLGMLKLASSVSVVHITSEPRRPAAFPGTRLLEYLSRHGIHAELTVESLVAADDHVVSAGLAQRANSLGGYLVMGGYGHSRMREFLFGGVTRSMLQDATVPVVIAR